MQISSLINGVPQGTIIDWYSPDLTEDCPWDLNLYLVFDLIAHNGTSHEESEVFLMDCDPDRGTFLSSLMNDALGFRPQTIISFARLENGEVAGPVQMHLPDGKVQNVELTEAVRQRLRNWDVREGEVRRVFTPAEINTYLQGLAEQEGISIGFRWRPELFDSRAHQKVLAEQDQQRVLDDYHQVVQAVQALPADVQLCWTDNAMGFERPFNSSWIDIALHDIQSEMDMNWVWTILHAPDAPAHADESRSSTLYVPFNARLSYQIAGDGSLHDCVLIGDDGSVLPVDPQAMPNGDEWAIEYRANKLAAGEWSEPLYGEIPTWTPDVINKALHTWCAEHAQRSDITFLWAPNGPLSPIAQQAADIVAEEGLATPREWRLIDGQQIWSDNDAFWTLAMVQRYREQIKQWGGGV